MKSDRKVAVLIGAAPGFGAALVERLAKEGYLVVGVSRSDVHANTLRKRATVFESEYEHYLGDAADQGILQRLVEEIRRSYGGPDVLIYNPMKLNVAPFLELAPQDFEEAWRASLLGAVYAAQAVLPLMVNAGEGTIIFTGATASVRGTARFAAFASAKFALRGLSQSLAREFGPQGIHIAHTILDGVIWGPQSCQRFNVARENCLDPNAVAEAYLQLIRQPRSAWTHELDMRPFSEKF